MLSRLKGKSRSPSSNGVDPASPNAAGDAPSRSPAASPASSPSQPQRRSASQHAVFANTAPLDAARSLSPTRAKRIQSSNRPRSQTYSLPPSVVAEWTTQEERRRASLMESQSLALADQHGVVMSDSTGTQREFGIIVGGPTPPNDEEGERVAANGASMGSIPVRSQTAPAATSNSTIIRRSDSPPQNFSGLSALAGINLSLSSNSSLPHSSSHSSLHSSSRPRSRSTSINTDSRNGHVVNLQSHGNEPAKGTAVTESASSSRKSTMLSPPLIQFAPSGNASGSSSAARSIRRVRSISGGADGSMAHSSSLRSSIIPASEWLPSDSVDMSGSGDPGSMLGDRAFMSMSNFDDFDDVVNQLGTGYAVASSKRNTDFHHLFKNVPDDDYLIEDYGCALQREILIQGRLYISEHHLSFNANIFGWVTTHVLPFSEILSIEKRMTAYVIPNAIQVTTPHARYTFASFLSRDTTYELIVNIWRMVHPPPLSDHGADDDEVSLDAPSDSVDAPKKNSRLAPTPTPSTAVAPISAKRRTRGDTLDSNSSLERSSLTAATSAAASALVLDPKRPGMLKRRTTTSRGDQDLHAPTVDSCPLLRNLKELAMDAVFASAPEKIYNLMFTSGFMKDFWINNQKLLELQISDWAPSTSNGQLLSRSLSYIKPLNGSIGPRQTKCIIVDENAHIDFDDFLCVITTTRTPDVPSGSAFAVKTRTSITWAKGNSCRVVVTTGVEWSKSSFIKGIIERSCIEGQKSYHNDLERAMRAYIQQHRSEFLESGHDEDNDPISPLDSATSSRDDLRGELGRGSADDLLSNEDRNMLNGEDGMWKSLTKWHPALKWIIHYVESWTPVFEGMMPIGLGFVVFVLVVSNIWTLNRGSAVAGGIAKEDIAAVASDIRLSAAGGHHKSPDEISSAVRSVLQDYFSGMPTSSSSSASAAASPVEIVAVEDLVVVGKKDERSAREIADLLDELEARIQRLRLELADVARQEGEALPVG